MAVPSEIAARYLTNFVFIQSLKISGGDVPLTVRKYSRRIKNNSLRMCFGFSRKYFLLALKEMVFINTYRNAFAKVAEFPLKRIRHICR